MKNDPLGALKPRSDPKLASEKQTSSKAKEFETKQQEQERSILSQQESNPLPQQTSSISQMGIFATISSYMDQPRILQFKSANVQQPKETPVIYNQESYFEKVPLDINTSGLKVITQGETLRGKTQTILVLQDQQKDWEGWLYITDYKFHFEPSIENFRLSRKDTFSVPLGFVQRVERIIEKNKQIDITYLEIYLKDQRRFKFKFACQQYEQSQILLTAFQKLSFPDHKNGLFAFIHHSSVKERNLEEIHKGWQIYKIDQDFQRMQINIQQLGQTYSGQDQPIFKYVDNKSGQICSTYYETIIVPAKADTEKIIKTAKFRTRERLPILSYAQITKDDRIISLWRSSQIKTGIQGNRSFEDEDYIKLMQLQGHDKYGELKIFDARPYLNAVGQKMAGKGFETEQNYNVKIEFLDIHNIHKVRESYVKLQQSCISDTNMSLTTIQASQWYDHVISLVVGAAKIANVYLRKKTNVLVHCSDGWDRTSQLMALVQIMIDPYYRTIEGLMVVIQKEWINSGHQFCTRAGTANKMYNSEEKAPVFVQFLDALYQLLHYYPMSFEYNIKMLTDLAFHYLSNLYGNFICDSYSELLRFKVIANTTSLWSKILEDKPKYLNSFYQNPNQMNKSYIIPIDFSGIHVRFWKEHFAYYHPGSADYYQIYPDLEFSDENIPLKLGDLQKQNHVLRMAQQDQERFIKAQTQKIDRLTRLIQTQPHLKDQLDEIDKEYLKEQ